MATKNWSFQKCTNRAAVAEGSDLTRNRNGLTSTFILRLSPRNEMRRLAGISQGQRNRWHQRKSQSRHTSGRWTGLRESVYQHRVGHFQVECHILDGDRVVGVG